MFVPFSFNCLWLMPGVRFNCPKVNVLFSFCFWWLCWLRCLDGLGLVGLVWINGGLVGLDGLVVLVGLVGLVDLQRLVTRAAKAGL